MVHFFLSGTVLGYLHPATLMILARQARGRFWRPTVQVLTLLTLARGNIKMGIELPALVAPRPASATTDQCSKRRVSDQWLVFPIRKWSVQCREGWVVWSRAASSECQTSGGLGTTTRVRNDTHVDSWAVPHELTPTANTSYMVQKSLVKKAC